MTLHRHSNNSLIMQKCRNAEMRKCRNAERQRYRNVEMQKCSNAAMQKCRNAEMQKCRKAERQKGRKAEMQKCRNAEMPKCRSAEMQNYGALRWRYWTLDNALQALPYAPERSTRAAGTQNTLHRQCRTLEMATRAPLDARKRCAGIPKCTNAECRNADMRKCRNAEMQTCRNAAMQTCGNLQMQIATQ
jgi:hypothetical protein